MATQLIKPPYPIYFNDKGEELDNGYIYVGEENKNAEASPVTTYWDEDLLFPAAQPLRTTNGYVSRDGSPARVFINGSAHSVIAKDRNMRQVYSALSVKDFSTAENIPFDPGVTGSIERTIKEKLSEQLSILDFGAEADGITDDSAALQKAIDYAKTSGWEIYCPSGLTVYVASSVNFKGVRNINFESNILVDSAISAIPITLGGTSAEIGGRLWFKNITDGSGEFATPPGRPIVRIAGLKSTHVRMGSCGYLQLRSSGESDERGVFYNRFDLDGVIRKLEFQSVPDTPAGVNPINENTFYRGRLTNLIIDGTDYSHNHNIFIDSTFEDDDTTSDVDIQILGLAAANKILRARFDGTNGSPGITFGADTYSNVVERTWSGSGWPADMFFNARITVNDAGYKNLVTTDLANAYKKINLFDINPGSGLLATTGVPVGESIGRSPRICPEPDGSDEFTVRAYITPGLKILYSASAFEWLAKTEMLRVERGNIITFRVDSGDAVVTAKWRLAIFCFDEDQKPLPTPSGGDPEDQYVALGGSVFIPQSSDHVNSFYYFFSDLTEEVVNQSIVVVLSDSVKYVKVAITTGSVNATYRSVGADMWVRPYGDNGVESAREKESMMALEGTPEQGYVPMQTLVWDYGASAMRRCTYAFETTVNGSIAAGAVACVVDNVGHTAIGNIANGDIVGVLLSSDLTHWTTVTNLDIANKTFDFADVVPVSPPVTVEDGARIVFNRWA